MNCIKYEAQIDTNWMISAVITAKFDKYCLGDNIATAKCMQNNCIADTWSGDIGDLLK